MPAPKPSLEDCLARARELDPAGSPEDLFAIALEVARGAQLAPSQDSQLRSALDDVVHELRKARSYAGKADRSDADQVVVDEIRAEALRRIARGKKLLEVVDKLVLEMTGRRAG